MRKMQIMVSVILFLMSLTAAQSQSKQGQLVALGDSIGVDIDSAERAHYQLFPGIEGFRWARIFMLPNGKYRLQYAVEANLEVRLRTIPVSAEAVDLTRHHIRFSQQYRDLRLQQPSEPTTEAQILYLLGLKYAALGRYDLTSQLWDDLIADYPTSSATAECQKLRGIVEQLSRTRTALFVEGALLDQSGRTDLLIFSGYYGLWLGIATPIALKARSSQAVAAGLLLGAPVSLVTTNYLTKQASISDARATMIALGGHLGTWQGIGWTAYADRKGNEVIGIGQLAGLAGIGVATWLTSKTEFSTGHASLTSAGLPWGAWFGAVTAALLDHSKDEVLRDMLIGSNALVLTAGIAAKDVQMSKARVRIINLAGVVGTFLGFGIDLLVEIKDASIGFAIAGLGSVAGLVAGKQLTKNFDRNKDLSFIFDEQFNFTQHHHQERVPLTIAPQVALLRNPQQPGYWMPGLKFQMQF